MSSHFLVIKLKDVIKTVIIAAAAIIILIVALSTSVPSFSGKNALYTPGTYQAALDLDKDHALIELTVDEDEIKSIELTMGSSNTKYFYPLLESTAALLENEIIKNQSLSVAVPEDASFTAGVILSAVEKTLNEASID